MTQVQAPVRVSSAPERIGVPPHCYSEFPIRSPLPVYPTRAEAELCRVGYLQGQ